MVGTGNEKAYCQAVANVVFWAQLIGLSAILGVVLAYSINL